MPYTLRILMIVLALILFGVAAVLIANLRIDRHTDEEARQVLSSAALKKSDLVQESDLTGLPAPVQRWLRRSGVIGKERIHTVRLKQTGRMRTKPDQPWMAMEAVQYINVDDPGFLWRVKVKAAPLIHLFGRDKYYEGHGSMVIKLLGIIPVADTKPGKEIDQSTMHRFLAEMIWYPTAALNDYINWTEIDAHSARATMNWRGVTADMVFNFNDQGDLVNNLASRYREVNGSFVLTDWGGIVRGYQEFNGMRILNKVDIAWKYETGDFNWLQIEVTDMEFNRPELY